MQSYYIPISLFEFRILAQIVQKLSELPQKLRPQPHLKQYLYANHSLLTPFAKTKMLTILNRCYFAFANNNDIYKEITNSLT